MVKDQIGLRALDQRLDALIRDLNTANQNINNFNHCLGKTQQRLTDLNQHPHTINHNLYARLKVINQTGDSLGRPVGTAIKNLNQRLEVPIRISIGVSVTSL